MTVNTNPDSCRSHLIASERCSYDGLQFSNKFGYHTFRAQIISKNWTARVNRYDSILLHKNFRHCFNVSIDCWLIWASRAGIVINIFSAFREEFVLLITFYFVLANSPKTTFHIFFSIVKKCLVYFNIFWGHVNQHNSKKLEIRIYAARQRCANLINTNRIEKCVFRKDR